MSGERKTVPFNPSKKTRPTIPVDTGKTIEPAKSERPTVPLYRGSREGKPSRGEAFSTAQGIKFGFSVIAGLANDFVNNKDPNAWNDFVAGPGMD